MTLLKNIVCRFVHREKTTVYNYTASSKGYAMRELVNNLIFND